MLHRLLSYSDEWLFLGLYGTLRNASPGPCVLVFSAPKISLKAIQEQSYLLWPPTVVLHEIPAGRDKK
jgi:hypothetical protein